MANTIIVKKSSTPGAVPAAGSLQPGELAVNLADAKLYSKTTGGTVIQLGGGGSTAYNKTTITATAGQTSFTVSYTVGYVDVWLNGVKLTSSEFTATSGTSVVLSVAAVAGDVFEAIAWIGTTTTVTALFDKARAYLNSTQSTVSGFVATKVQLDTVSYDTNSIWDATNKRFVPKKAGYYQCNCRVRTNTIGNLGLIVAINAITVQAGSTDGSVQAASGSSLVYCNGSTDYIELFYAAGSVRTITTGSFDTYMEVLGPF